MNLSIPFGPIAGAIHRIITLARQNPCTIEIVEGVGGNPRQFVRIRNDSKLPVQLFGVSFRWRSKDSSKFDEHHTPLVWIISGHTKGVLNPGHSFEHPVDPHELGKPVAECIVSVEHNRQPKPEEKRFAVKLL